MINWENIIGFCRNGSPAPDKRILRTQAEWKDLLSEEEFRITRLKGTERAFSSEMCSVFEPGIYACKCCGTKLFNSEEKFESGTGWPSFSQPISVNSIAYHADYSFGMVRVEVICNACEAHLGHVFPDGPGEAGVRYCINALSLAKTGPELPTDN
jgi:peptide-methionine (R)-S-oxide reductase